MAVVPTACWGALITYDIGMNTAPLVGHTAGPFSIEFQLNDGSGTNDGNNSALLSNFTFGGGSVVVAPTLTGGATGNAATSISLTDSSFFNQFIQEFTPGSKLGFRLALTTNLDIGGAPDQFTLAILDSSGTELPTRSSSNVFLQIDIDSANPLIQTFATDTSRMPAAGGNAIQYRGSDRRTRRSDRAGV
ncbi:MAG: hypothetical protein ACR2NN_14465 [Bryobacteraceae bacterium]